jgi:hypothetical protein
MPLLPLCSVLKGKEWRADALGGGHGAAPTVEVAPSGVAMGAAPAAGVTLGAAMGATGSVGKTSHRSGESVRKTSSSGFVGKPSSSGPMAAQELVELALCRPW